MATIVGLCTIELHLPGVGSLKEKRSILKPLLSRLHNTFNVSAAEVDHQDVWQSATIAVASVSNSTSHANQVISHVLAWIEANFPDTLIVHQEIEIL
jgi:uncharacterized protein YlxP (DUF503 family)